MALLFCDGFDSYSATSDLTLGRFLSVGSLTYSSTAGRFGGSGIVIPNTSSIAGGTLKVISGLSLSNTLFGGFWFKQTATPIYGFSSNNQGFGLPNNAGNGTLVSCQANTGFVQIGNIGNGTVLGTGSHFNVCDGQWHWIEFQIAFATSATGSAKVWVDGILEVNVSSVVTITGGLTLNGYATLYNMINGNLGSPFAVTTFDDLILWDNTGTAFNTAPLGPQRISTLVPNADGDLTQFTPKSAGAHYLMVNGGYTSTNYVSDTGTGNVDLYKFPALSYSPATVSAVVATYYGQNPGTGNINLSPVLKTSGTQVSGTAQQLPNGTNAVYSKSWYADASGSAWTTASVNAMQLGIGD